MMKEPFKSGTKLAFTNPRTKKVHEVVYRQWWGPKRPSVIMVSSKGEERPALWYSVDIINVKPV